MIQDLETALNETLYTMTTNRRQFIARTALATAFARCAPLLAAEAKPRFRIGAFDWSMS